MECNIEILVEDILSGLRFAFIGKLVFLPAAGFSASTSIALHFSEWRIAARSDTLEKLTATAGYSSLTPLAQCIKIRLGDDALLG